MLVYLTYVAFTRAPFCRLDVSKRGDRSSYRFAGAQVIAGQTVYGMIRAWRTTLFESPADIRSLLEM